MAVQNGVSASALSQRLRNEEVPEAAVNALLPIIVHGKPFKTVKSVADFYKIPCATVHHRVKKLKMSYEDAISLPEFCTPTRTGDSHFKGLETIDLPVTFSLVSMLAMS